MEHARSICHCAIAALAACGQMQDQTLPPVTDGVVAGTFNAQSSTARGITGDVRIERAGLAFDSGVVLYTRVLQSRHAGDLIAKGGDSYAAAALGAGDLVVELRRVGEQIVPVGAVGLCGQTQPLYVALLHDERAIAMTLIVFSGEEPPGREATRSRVCARYSYSAPDGARTREGVADLAMLTLGAFSRAGRTV